MVRRRSNIVQSEVTPRVVSIWRQLRIISSGLVSLSDNCCLPLSSFRRGKYIKKHAPEMLFILWLPSRITVEADHATIPLILSDVDQSSLKDYSTWTSSESNKTDEPIAILVPQWVTGLSRTNRVDVWLLDYSRQSSKVNSVHIEDGLQLSVMKYENPGIGSHCFPESSSHRSFNSRLLTHPDLTVATALYPFGLFPNNSIVHMKVGSSYHPFIIRNDRLKPSTTSGLLSDDYSLTMIRLLPEPFIIILPDITSECATESASRPPHVEEYLKTVLTKLTPDPPAMCPIVHSVLLENMTQYDQIVFLRALVELRSTPTIPPDLKSFQNHYLTVQLHRCPLAVHLSNSALYRKSFCSRVASDGQTENSRAPDLTSDNRKDEPITRLGALEPKTLPGQLLHSYCRKPIRWNFAAQSEGREGRELIVLILDDVHHLTLSEWLEVEQIVRALVMELIEIYLSTGLSYVAPISLLLLCFWDSAALNQSPVPPVLRRFFERRWDRNPTDPMSGLILGNNYHPDRFSLSMITDFVKPPAPTNMDAQVAAWRRNLVADEISCNEREEVVEAILHASNTTPPSTLDRVVLAHRIMQKSVDRRKDMRSDNGVLKMSYKTSILTLLPELSNAMLDRRPSPSDHSEPPQSFTEFQISAIHGIEFSIFEVLEHPVSQS